MRHGSLLLVLRRRKSLEYVASSASRRSVSLLAFLLPFLFLVIFKQWGPTPACNLLLLQQLFFLFSDSPSPNLCHRYSSSFPNFYELFCQTPLDLPHCYCATARWLHNPDSAWLLFGVCACLAAPPILDSSDVVISSDATTPLEELNEFRVENDVIMTDVESENSDTFKVTGVPADGRCLFRAIAHVACLRKGEDVPDENRQRELADELRALVVEELLKRRKEAEWFIEGDFDAYVERIEKPYVWGGEPELLMSSHVLKTPIAVFMLDRSSGSLKNIANYGEEYRKNEDCPINVLFHGYGHYDILDVVPEAYQKVEA